MTNEKTITLNITDMEMAEPNENTLEIVSGDFYEGETVTVRINGKEYTRKVKYSAKKYADLYITINGITITYEEFANPEAFRDCDYNKYL